MTKTAITEPGLGTAILAMSLIWWGSVTGDVGVPSIPPPWLSEVIRRYPLPSVPTDTMYPLGGAPAQPQQAAQQAMPPGQHTIAPQQLAQRPQQPIPAL